MRELHEKGYVIYEPSYNPFKGSMLQMVNLSHELKPVKRSEKTNSKNKQVIEQEVNKQQTSSETATEQALVSSINNINNTNNANILNLDKSKNDLKKDEFKNQSAISLSEPVEESKTKKKLREKKGEATENAIPPQWQYVVQFFSECNVPEIEAQKYYNHFQSNGWLVSGKSKMKNWKAAARNWMLNSQKFNKTNTQPQPNHLHTSIHKNYAEPL
ncbi:MULTISPECIES: transcriptional regulator [Flavobacterium]|uniref:Transcriptional regulator n=1 Tax=Flavobacterium hankyongi TaxID=1176532 RepID=A0ABP8ZRU5_9FLAO|nr:transcriptional regulator [Flavobacterium sp. N1846]